MMQNNFNSNQNIEGLTLSSPDAAQLVQGSSPESEIVSSPENNLGQEGLLSDSQQDVDLNLASEKVVIDNTNIIEAPINDIVKNEVKEETSSQVDKEDRDYLQKIKEVIRHDAATPYVEEEEAEVLSKSYLKSRFGVDIKIDEEN